MVYLFSICFVCSNKTHGITRLFIQQLPYVLMSYIFFSRDSIAQNNTPKLNWDIMAWFDIFSLCITMYNMLRIP